MHTSLACQLVTADWLGLIVQEDMRLSMTLEMRTHSLSHVSAEFLLLIRPRADGSRTVQELRGVDRGARRSCRTP